MAAVNIGAALTLGIGHNAGPFLINGALYMAGRTGADMAVWKASAADPFASGFVLQDAAHEPTNAGTYFATAVTVDGSKIYCISQTSASSGSLVIGVYDCTTDTWSAADAATITAVGTSVAASGIGIAVRSNGDVVITYSTTTATYYRKRVGAVWSAATSISATASQTRIRAVLGASDRVHFFYGVTGLFTRSLSNADALDTEAQVSANVSQAGYPIAILDSGTTRIRITYRSSTSPNHAFVGLFDSGANPVVTTNDVADAAASVYSAVAADSTTLYAMWTRNSDGSVMYDKSAGLGGAWGADVSLGPSAQTRVACNVYQRANAVYLGYIYCNESNAVYFNELFIRELAHTFSVSQQGGQQKLSDPSFELSTLGNAPNAPWTQFLGGGCPAPTTWAVQNGWASDGTQSMRITTGNHTLAGNALYLMQTAAAQVGVVAKALYRLQADFNVLTLPVGMFPRVMIEWHDAGGSYISQSYGNYIQNPTTGLFTSVVEAVAPANAATGRAVIYISGTGIGDLYVDNVRFGYVPTLVRLASRIFVPSQSASVALVTTDLRKLSATQAQLAGIIGQASRTQAPTQAQAVAVVTTVSRAMALTQAQVENLAAATARLVAASQDQAATSAQASARIFAASQAEQADVASAITRTLALTQAEAASVRGDVTPQAIIFTQDAGVGLAGDVSRTLTAGQAQSPTVRGSGAFAFAITQTQGASLLRLLSMAYNLTQAAVSALDQPVQPTTLSVTQSSVALLQMAASRSLTTAQGAAASLRRSLATTRAVSQASTPTRTRVSRGATLTATQPQAAIVSAHTAGQRAVAQVQVPSRTGIAARAARTTQAQGVRVQRQLPGALSVSQSQTSRMTARLAATRSCAAPQAVFRTAPSIAKRLTVGQAASPTRSATVAVTFAVAQDQLAFIPAQVQRGTLTADLLGPSIERSVTRREALATVFGPSISPDIDRQGILVGAVAASSLESERQ